jgi:hypothetical protein
MTYSFLTEESTTVWLPIEATPKKERRRGIPQRRSSRDVDQKTQFATA